MIGVAHRGNPTPQKRHELSIEQRRKAMKYLPETRDVLELSVSNLTEEQWNFKPSAQRWSVLDVLEHLVFFETYTYYVTSSMKDLPPDESGYDPLEIEQFLLNAVPDRSKKLQSLALGHPTCRWNSIEVIEQFLLARART